MRTFAVIVTYNRLPLLKECVAALLAQSRQPDRIIIVDNCSTDDTAQYLDTLRTNPLFHIETLEENTGGAGGFSHGLKTAVLMGADFTWLMDDDTIPERDNLEKLLEAQESANNVGYVCSKVLWTDGTPHLMNRPALAGNDEADANGSVPCITASFVSILVSTKAVLRVGLPIKEFFIWCDDLEYTLRIHRAGYTTLYAPQAVALHKTATNYYPNIVTAPQGMAKRYYYQMRNSLYIMHTEVRNKWLFRFKAWNKLRIQKHRISKRKDEESKPLFLSYVKEGCRDGLNFSPQIEYIDPSEIKAETCGSAMPASK